MSSTRPPPLAVAEPESSSSLQRRQLSRQYSSRIWSPLHHRTVSAAHLADFLQEGDIVLFKGKRAVDAGMRWFMKSEYNHSALVVNVHGELQLFEATASGVGCCPLEFYVNAFYWLEMSSRFHTIAVRRLYCEFPVASGGGERHGLTTAMRVALLRYESEMSGRAFERNPLEYIKPLLNVKQRENFGSVFCSELVAGAYKRMGLLPAARSANDYLPRDFAEHPPRGARAAQLEPGARWGHEVHVVFAADSPYRPHHRPTGTPEDTQQALEEEFAVYKMRKSMRAAVQKRHESRKSLLLDGDGDGDATPRRAATSPAPPSPLRAATPRRADTASGTLPTRVSEEPEEAPPLELADVGVESVDVACGCLPWRRRARRRGVKSSVKRSG